MHSHWISVHPLYHKISNERVSTLDPLPIERCVIESSLLLLLQPYILRTNALHSSITKSDYSYYR
jgi:hypothetical protein